MRLFAGSVASSPSRQGERHSGTRPWAAYRVIVQVQWSPREARALRPGRPAAIRRTHDRAHGGGRVKHWRHGERALAARGFTLVELVIALSILGILSLLLVNGLGLATRTWDAVEQRTTEAHQGHLSVIFLQRQIELAQPLRLSRDASAKQITFVGQQHALRFVAPLPGHLGAGGMYWFALGLVDSSGGQALGAGLLAVSTGGLGALWRSRTGAGRADGRSQESAIRVSRTGHVRRARPVDIRLGATGSPAASDSGADHPRVGKRWPVARISRGTEAGYPCTRGVTS